MNFLFESFLYGISTSIHPCAIITLLSALAILYQLSHRDSYKYLGLFLLSFFLSSLTIGSSIIFGLTKAFDIHQYIESFNQIFLGPTFIIIGMHFIELIKLPKWSLQSSIIHSKSSHSFGFSYILLGVFFSISLCPSSALIFFGIFLPKCLQHQSPYLSQIMFSIGQSTFIVLFILLNRINHRFLKGQEKFNLIISQIIGISLIIVGSYHCFLNLFTP